MSGGYSLPRGVRELLASRIESYDELQVLLALRVHAGRCPTQSIARWTNLPEIRVQDAARALCQRGLAVANRERPNVFEYAPADANTDALVRRLAGIYQKRELDVIRAMTALSLQRLRRRAVQAFAEFLRSGRRRAGRESER